MAGPPTPGFLDEGEAKDCIAVDVGAGGNKKKSLSALVYQVGQGELEGNGQVSVETDMPSCCTMPVKMMGK